VKWLITWIAILEASAIVGGLYTIPTPERYDPDRWYIHRTHPLWPL